MGKVEKIAVLSVLFLIAVILVVSMTTDNPVDTAHAAVLGDKSGATSSATPEAGSKLLSSNVTDGAPSTTAPAAAVPTPAPAVPQPIAIPTGSLLRTTEGLTEGYDSQRLMYTWQSGDSYVALAKRLYGEPTKFTLIQNANEGREGIQSGEKILVPIFDVEPAVEVATPKVEKPATTKKKPAASDVAKSAVPSAAGRSHTVKKGESLWKIAKAELGDANRWSEIYELNKDKLKTPEALRDGMQLRLP